VNTIAMADAPSVPQHAGRLAEVRSRIEAAAGMSGRSGNDVTLVAVCKTVGRAEVDAAYAAGQRDFGENRVQDALAKFESDVPADLHLHMIGSLQTNKVRQVVGKFQLIHSVDRTALADEIQRRAAALGVVQPILVQVNIAREEQKHGCLVEDLPRLIESILGHSNIALQGLMTMAPLTASAEEARPIFAGLYELRQHLRAQYPDAVLNHLSMGMTNDFPAAVEEGATIVRVGRAIFA
jgi:pyridoxal phosphate enzyme (YggS family)